MQTDSLRKVKYTLEGVQEGSFYDYEEGEREEILKERDGLFHCLGNQLSHGDNGETTTITMAFIEDSDTHQIKHIVPKRVRFID